MSRLRNSLLILTLLVAGAHFFGCGEKTTLPSDLPKPVYGGIDTNYVFVTPIWTEAGGVAFNRPQDVYIGYDQLVYICDTDNHRVLKMELDGTLIESYPVKHPVSIAQDRGLDLLVVCGEYRELIEHDSTADTINYSNVVFRQRYRGNRPFELVYRGENSGPGDVAFLPGVYYGIAASPYPNKDYYVADFAKNRILEMTFVDDLRNYILETGVGLNLTQYPCDLTVYEIAGQVYLALAQGAPNVGVQLFGLPDFINQYQEGDTLPPLVRFTARSFKDVAVDELLNFYVLNDEPDPLLGTRYYLYKYDRRGELLLALGTLGSGERQFNRPNGIAYHNGVLYIADTYNNRVVRYTLTTEIQN